MKTLKELQEATKGKHAVLVFGRMQPPTTGHSKVIEKAISYPGDHHLYVSHGQNAKSDPLTADEKLDILRKSYPTHKKAFKSSSKEEPTIFHAMANLHKQGYTHVTVVTGSDRQGEFQEKLDKYNGKFKVSPDGKDKSGYAFNKINVVSAAERNEQNNVSGTKVRDAAIKGDFESVRSMIHHNVTDDEVHALMSKIRTRVKPKSENLGKRDKKNYVDTVLKSKGLTRKDVAEDFLNESLYLDEISKVKLVNYMNKVVADNDKPEGALNKRSREKREKSNKAFSKAFTKVYAGNIREDYKDGKLFKVGDIVETKDGQLAEIINLGTNYLTLVKEGNIFKRWLDDVKISENKPLKLKESPDFNYKGYTPRNFNSELKNVFADLCSDNEDSYALLNCIKSTDALLDISNLNEKFEYYRTEYDRALRYMKKFDIPTSVLSNAEDKLLEYAIVEGVSFAAADQSKVAAILAMSAGVSSDGSPVDVVNSAAIKMKAEKHTPEGWKIWGKMLNLATKAGIKWDKNIYAKPTQKFMELV
jgi:hypothetical protein